MDEQRAREMLDRADPDAAKQVVLAVAPVFDDLTAQVWAFGLAEGRRWAVAVVAQMGSELTLAASQLYAAQRWYAGAALVRQLVEVEYLLYLFATDDEEPDRWLMATSDEVRQMFAPSAMRKRAGTRFRCEEYASHCEFGGHPRRRAHWLLREHGVIEPAHASPEIQWVDLAQHLRRAWTNYCAAVARHSPSNVYPDRFAKIDELFNRWQLADPTPDAI